MTSYNISLFMHKEFVDIIEIIFDVMFFPPSIKMYLLCAVYVQLFGLIATCSEMSDVSGSYAHKSLF